MAKMHSRKKGTSGSKRPLKLMKPTWVRYTEKELEMLVAKLAKEGHSSSVIGIILRDSYGIPDVKLLINKAITEILAEKSLLPKLPEDLLALMRKMVDVKKHRFSHKQDMTALRGQQLTEAKIKRLIKYYKAKKRLPVDFVYDPENLKLYTEG